MKVSIIIPVYNTEKYLKRCVDSCINQSIEDIEIILIDDCSDDSSRNIILDYAMKYPDKIRYIFQKENHRQGAARNRGMEIAIGEYIAFVDSDDWIEPDTCETLYRIAKEGHADMVGFDFFWSWDDRQERVMLDWHNEDVGSMSKSKKEYLISVCGMFWTRIYSAKFLKEAQLFFPENIYYEDAVFNFYSILLCNEVLKVDKAFYHYYQGNKSTVRNRNKQHQYERIDAAECLYNFRDKNNLLKQYRDLIFNKYIDMACANILYICLDCFDKPDIHQMKRIHKLICEKNKKYTKSKAFLRINGRVKFFSRINAFSPRFCVLAYRLRVYDVLKKIKGILK